MAREDIVGDLEVSVLICTSNRADSLALTLRSLERMSVTPGREWEVVVIDDGSTDHTPAVLRDHAARLPLRFVSQRRGGLARARNAALAAARGRLILVTDDDCRVSPDWMAVAVRELADHPMQLIGGRVELGDPSDLPLAIKTSTVRESLTSVAGLWGFIHGANMAFGRCVVDRVGPFDGRFGAGAGLRSAEDTEFAYRVLKAGIPIHYEPDLLVHHFHGRRGPGIWYRQVGDHAFGFGAMAAKYALRRDFGLARAVYWDMRSTLRANDWRRVRAKLKGLAGAARFLTMRNRAAE